ncbi:hypothetical protein ACJMK2_034544 [Sinanodonta woodiana]|uniref:ABC transporter domain-containing protein n=1 Tax=Sinanodonta woodiana TaxID=1069815 RepID=A0ABD3WSG9_SINWO
MTISSFWCQFKALVWKNFLLKKRNKKETIQEFLMPIYFILILAMIKFFIKPQTVPQLTDFPVTDLFSNSFHPNLSKILVSPNETYVHNIMSKAGDVLKDVLGKSPEFEYFTSKLDAEKKYKANSNAVSAGVIFDYDRQGKFSYVIRMPYENIARTGVGVNQYLRDQAQCRQGTGLDNINCDANTYLYTGFSALQVAIDTAFIRETIGNADFSMPRVAVQMMPKPSYTPDGSYIQILSAIYFVLAYSPFINFLTINLVSEKEKKIKEGMRMMGLKDTVFWLSWTTVYVIIITIVTLVVVAIASAVKFFANSNLFLFFLMLFFYGLSIIALSFAITPFFNNARTAGGVASLGTMVISLLYLIISLTRSYTSSGLQYSIPVGGRWVLCLLSPVALALAIDQGIFLDIIGGMNFETAARGEFPLIAPVMMLLLDSVLYFLLAVYLDHVVPGEYGPRYPPWFCFTKAFWCGCASSGKLSAITKERETPYQDDLADIEAVSRETMNNTAIRMFYLTKIFKSKEKKELIQAVDGLSLTVYENQITALLGHNGAGKTTTMNILCGLTSATAGTAYVYNLDVSKAVDMAHIRTMTGVCPQHNILFDQLTCREHLSLFASIKGVPDRNVNNEVSKSLENVDLMDKANSKAKDLSGGQKRKLSVAIALIGNSKIIFLDEPTAGMDPNSRRQIWSLLREKKAGRVILLTTHFMDEADILADRKAIISKGKLRCCGSSLYLKKKFGIGYHLGMNIRPGCDLEKIKELVTSIVPGAEVDRVHGKELNITLPHAEVSRFSELFSTLERTNLNSTTVAEELGIVDYGVSMTTLEEVFLKLEHEQDCDLSKLLKKNGATEQEAESNILIPKSRPEHTVSNLNLSDGDTLTTKSMHPAYSTSRSFWTLFKIRFIMNRRSKSTLFYQLLMPVIFLIIGMVINKNSQPQTDALNPLSFQLLSGYYIKIRNISLPNTRFGPTPPLLIKDSVGSVFSSSFLAGLNRTFYSDPYTNYSDLLSKSPHYLGLDLNEFIVNNASKDVSCGYTALYNDSAIHAIPAMINLMSNSLLIAAKISLGLTTNSSIISVSNLPWPATKLYMDYNNAAFSSVILLAMAFVIIPSGFGVDIVKDRQVKARSQLRISGVPFAVYWGSFMMIDIIKFIIPAILAVIFIFTVQVPSLQPAGAVLTLILVCLMYIPSNLLLSYVFSFAFGNHETAMAVMPMFFVFAGFMPYLPVFLVDAMSSESVAAILHYVFCFIDPPYLIFGGIFYIDKVYRVAERNLAVDRILFSDYFNWSSQIDIVFIAPILHVLILFLLLRILDIRSTGGAVSEAFGRATINLTSPDTMIEDGNSAGMEAEDEDVKEETKRVNYFVEHANFVVALVKDLWKEFPVPGEKKKGKKKLKKTKAVVKNVSFAVEAGEVFGLLGPNGAGKTTTLNMMTADVAPTRGKVFLGGHDIRSSMSEAFQATGYCPQHDTLWDSVTLREHLLCYAAIKGVPHDEMNAVLNFYLKNLRLDEHADKRAKMLSGGTKRKLSYTISMLGKPKIVLLDEPSTGMDPQSKRFFWDTVTSTFENSDSGAILTTHYMEEADALCSRIAILVNGKMQCIGSSQHLKTKYGSGYLLEVKLKGETTHAQSNDADMGVCLSHINVDTLDQRMESLHQYIEKLFPNRILLESFGDRAHYRIPMEHVRSLGKIFTDLEEGKKNNGIEEYSFSQSTLEQIFLDFAKKQQDSGETEEEREEVIYNSHIDSVRM